MPAPTARSGVRSRRRAAARALLAALVATGLLALVGAAPVGDHGAAARPPVPGHHVLLALGDSVPAGRACGCVPFPEAYGSLLARRTRTQVSVDNRAVSGLDTAGLVDRLGAADLRDAVRRADIVVVTIGANDFTDHHDQVTGGGCARTGADCVADERESMGEHLRSILATIRTLRAGEPTTILVTGYWNVFEDGDVARRAYGAEGLRESLGLTRAANAAIRSAAVAAGARYVDLFVPFRQPGRDVTSLLAADGDHPNAAGHELIARELVAAGLPAVR